MGLFFKKKSLDMNEFERQNQKLHLSKKQREQAIRWNMLPKEYIRFNEEADSYGLTQYDREQAVRMGLSPNQFDDEINE